uniref:EndoU domain-containing protein n=1 Tax=Oryza punctata TaxID=4537 RepID=A0A0E0KTE0_ORYPU
MDGLIKGLINVAIDAVEGAGRGERGDEDDAPRRHRPAREEEEEEGRGDERSRSTWAEVVSDHKGGDPEERPAHRNSRRDGRQERREDGDWETVGGRKQHQHNQYEEEGRRDNSNRRPQQQQQAPAYRRQQQDGGERADGGWQTVGEKKHHGKPQKSEAWNAYRRPPSEQQYCEDAGQIHHGLNVEPTREELNSLSKACSRLWELDMNRLTPGKDYRIECGEGKKVYQKGDMASETLFSWLGDDVLRKPTYSRFCALLDNYNPHQGYKEVVTEQDKHEEVAFIEEIARTAPIKYLHRYLVLKGVASQDYEDFKRMLTSIWFDLYGRGGSSSSSSAFEHVFVGEIKGRGQGENEFEWHGVLKSVSSTLIGVSPEFEVALYTLCFFMGGEDNRVEIGPYGVNIKCYRMGNSKIGSAFPIAEN